ncbi:MAG: CDP-alcohol phosphatidyltransferase family protein [Phycisphaerae bacterium]|nr:CDP-alcohol phosphatidyltransferase family protein [Phycisphaerae bacterium]
MKARLPNLITSVRFLLALVFAVLMENYHFGRGNVHVLDWAFGIFCFTAVTDILDGYLARRWKQESTFGRIVDPLVDKVLVIAAFLYLASNHFAELKNGALVNASGVAVWMVVLILVRELLVTGLRGFSESQGLSFKATIPGKIKMFVQCVSAGTAMIVTAHQPAFLNFAPWAIEFRQATLWAMVVVTTFSMLVYIERARMLLTVAMRGPEKNSPAAKEKPPLT